MNGLIRLQGPDFSPLAGFGRLSDLRDEIERLFDAPLAEFARTTQLLSGWTPALDMSEDKDNIYVRLELPGMKKEDIELSLHEGSLSIVGERKVENKSKDSEVYRSERFFGRFQRTISLPKAVTVEKVKAQYTDGILTVTLPKAEEAKPKHIDVSTN